MRSANFYQHKDVVERMNALKNFLEKTNHIPSKNLAREIGVRKSQLVNWRSGAVGIPISRILYKMNKVIENL